MGRAREGEVFRKWCVDLPEPIRVLWAKALELASLCGARSTQEAVEFIAVTFEQAMLEPMSEWRRKATEPDAVFRLACLDRDGWRCRLCGTSRTLTVHHVVPRSECRMAGRLDLLVDPRNGAVVCNACHDRVQPVWKDYLDRLSNE